MIATGSLSMWISNTASTVVMLPIALSVINLLINDEDGFTKNDQNFALSVMLGIAFSANAGGIATVIGTPPNSVLIGLLENEYNTEISFLKWMTIGLPFSIVMISICYLVLVKWMYPNRDLKFNASKEVIQSELEKLGPTSGKEKLVLAIFGVTVFLWIFRTLINSIFPDLGLTDTMISIFAALALFSVPYSLKRGDFIIGWKDTSKLAWGILILFGGGLALGLDIPILYLLIPVTIASSCAFMLPMATPPNAIVFASGHVKIAQMARVGIILNLIAVVLLILVFQFVIPVLF
jgi:sodium-dependent dicarboxylate transporter 2/3/5